MELASQAREHAYAPYSRYHVGAALLCRDGTVYLGSNIENASYGATNCAERTAFFKAIYDGKRDFDAIAIVGNARDGAEDFCFPCGICRQIMLEFCDRDFRLLFHNEEGTVREFTLFQIIPFGFTPEHLATDESFPEEE